MQMKKIKFPKAAQWPIQPVGTVCEAGGGGTLQIRTSRCLRLGSRAQTSDFCFKPLINPPPKECSCFPAMSIKTALLSPMGRMSLSLIEEGERQGTHAVTTVGICTEEITKGRPKVLFVVHYLLFIALFVALGELPLLLSLPHPERDGNGKVWTACTAP